ncbi:hypothetical protein SAMN05443574_13520 [Haloarcula vallismortis]|uniref:Uncharacterized protein n=2 Tax=Haloarcula vallismortis TaxID=28442 RepID=M0J7E1_HALVA|nr:hypothetical protein [Haloarcula vallismortis]EMA04273.1 hypothetical protein C437_13972 [Haloarcula vallismortis ATCC 29715]SDX35626.1 hypothetical protein SAMN05443574_13520 [Haloarcula vallismortis]
MSTDSENPRSTKITLTFEEGHWVATDEDSGLTAQAPTREEALEALDATVAVQEGGIDADDPFFSAPAFEGEPTDEEDVDDIVYGEIEE